MTLKIFYFLIALFSVSVVFGLFDNSYNFGFNKDDVKLANMKALNVKAYELNATNIDAVYKADEVVRYDEHDEVFGFDGFFQNDNLHRLSSDFAIIKDKNVTMKQNAMYQNSDENLTYSSNEIIWGEGFLRSNVPFTITQNGDRVSGASGSYDINNKKIKAKNVKGEFNR